MQTSFPKALALTLKYEGGWANNPHDPGGCTMHGVTQRTYDAWRKAHKLPTHTVAAITASELSAIYEGIWAQVKADTLPAGVDALAFDIAVNSGAVESNELCAQAEALARKTQKEFIYLWISDLDAARRGFWRHLSIFKYFWKGWFAREDAMLALARQLAAEAAPVA